MLTIDEEPIFLLGTGRCGSTLQQSVLSGIDDVWIWGEHNGVIGKLMAWGEAVKSDHRLREFSYSQSNENISTIMSSSPTNDALPVAWLNYFRPTDIDEQLRLIISNIFKLGLPSGKRRWGFKEIRYGREDKTAESLLNVFPKAKILYTVRDPFKTCESSIYSWHYQPIIKFVQGGNKDEISQLYTHYMNRWISSAKYFARLKQERPECVYISRIEAFWDNLESILDFLNINKSSYMVEKNHYVINSSANRARSDTVATLMKALHEQRRKEIVEVARIVGYEL
jgi:hypothetical protein